MVRHFKAILAAVSSMIREQHIPVAEDGVVVASSWSAVDDAAKQLEASTMSVTPLKTGGIIGDDGDTGFGKPRVDVGTIAVGFQYAPKGGERAIVFPTESTPVSLMIHGSNDTDPTLNPGEWSLRHFTAASSFDSTSAVPFDISIYSRNDGVTAGDGLGSIVVLSAALFNLGTTNNPQMLIVDDATGTVQLAQSGTNAADGLVRMSDLQAALDNQQMVFQTALNALAAIVESGSGVTAPTVASVTATASMKSFTA